MKTMLLSLSLLCTFAISAAEIQYSIELKPSAFSEDYVSVEF